MKQLLPILALLMLTAVGCSEKYPAAVVEWSTLGNVTDTAGHTTYTQRFTIVTDGPFSRLAFNQFARRMEPLDEADTLIEIVPGYYAVASPRFEKAAKGDTIVVDILTHAALRSICYAPDGVHLVMPNGKTEAVVYNRVDIIGEPSMWSTPDRDLMPYGDAIFDRNAQLETNYVVGPYDVIPSYKKLQILEGTSEIPATIEFKEIAVPRPGYYKITVDNDKILLETDAQTRASAERRFWRNTRDRELVRIPNAVIEDWPDFQYRGIMIDVARNFISPAQMRRVLSMMADYGFNVLHFHFADDEAWRLEIPSLPELTEVGGRRGYTLDEKDFLPQIFAGDGSPDTKGNTSNGYYTRKDFIDMLTLADSLGIAVLPEVESPGHIRAAIRAMEKRARNTGDDSWLLRDPADTSVFTSAQSFHDNALNPALPGPYKLMETVGKEIKGMYDEAGVNLPAIHIGGDEVPRGAWAGSPAAQKFMEENGLETQEQLHAYFVRRINKMYKDMGIKISGWQEIGLGHDDDYNREILDNVYSVNCWSTLGAKASAPLDAVMNGYPVVLSNVDHCYLDMVYSNHPMEYGLNWGGTVDEFDTLSGYAKNLCDAPEEAPGQIIGMSGQLFSETVRGDSQMEHYLLPKMTGLAERAWNSTPTYSEPVFQAVISQAEMPLWVKDGYNFHLRQPGIKVIGKDVYMNNPYGDIGEVHYTIDGSNPTLQSPTYQGPFPAQGLKEIRAIITFDGKESVPTILYID